VGAGAAAGRPRRAPARAPTDRVSAPRAPRLTYDRRVDAAVAGATPALNFTGRVLLGMVAEGHRTGYAIKAEIERTTRLYWGASIGGIYPELRRLERAGLLRSREDYRGESRRHAYEITDAGRRVLREWLTDPALELRHEALLRLRFGEVLPPAERVELLRRMRAAHERRLAELQERLALDDFDDPLHRLTFEFGAGWNAWARDWCLDAERRLALDA
jgi:DNA-binding PadR family transcriptional regulator